MLKETSPALHTRRCPRILSHNTVISLLTGSRRISYETMSCTTRRSGIKVLFMSAPKLLENHAEQLQHARTPAD
jgi:hypothetical protein